MNSTKTTFWKGAQIASPLRTMDDGLPWNTCTTFDCPTRRRRRPKDATPFGSGSLDIDFPSMNFRDSDGNGDDRLTGHYHRVTRSFPVREAIITIVFRRSNGRHAPDSPRTAHHRHVPTPACQEHHSNSKTFSFIISQLFPTETTRDRHHPDAPSDRHRGDAN